MRELKFRLIRDGKIVGYEKWYPGQGKPGDVTSAEPIWLYSTDGEYWNPKYIIHDSKDQFTGLKDKNGVMIYESDIVKGYTYWSEGEPFKTVVIFADGMFIPLVTVEVGYNAINDYSPSSYEIIGNIHEDKGLLK